MPAETDSQEPLAWLNGALSLERDARLCVRDLALLRGLSVYETVRVEAGRALRLEAHLARMLEGLSRTGIEAPDPSLVRRAVAEVTAAWGPRAGALRITRTAGDPPSLAPSLLVTIGPPRPLPEGARERGVGVAILAPLEHPQPGGALAGCKTGSYTDRVLARRRAQDLGAYEAILCDPAGAPAEGAMTTVFWVKGGVLRTPSLDLGILPGVTRAALLRLARASGVPLAEGRFPADDLRSADEAFLSSSLAGALPIASVDGRALPASPGPITRRLSDLLEAELLSS